MTSERPEQIFQLLDQVGEMTTSEREAFLHHVCAADPELRQEVESLLAFGKIVKDRNFMEQPPRDITIQTIGEWKVGQQIGNYELRSRLDRGGMGEIWLAKHRELPREVAIKVLLTNYAQDTERLRRFVEEAHTASALSHPNIIIIYESGRTENNAYYIAEEFIEGETLRHRLYSGRMQWQEAVKIAQQVASALYATGKKGIIHRDIKPENIMVRREDGLVKVIDFGIAKPTESRAHEILPDGRITTKPCMVLGTPSYMSPEQIQGKTLDRRTDIFSLGVVLYEMVAGEKPFNGRTLDEVIEATLSKDPEPLDKYRVPTELKQIITKALKKNREERYQTADEMLNDLKKVKPISKLRRVLLFVKSIISLVIGMVKVLWAGGLNNPSIIRSASLYHLVPSVFLLVFLAAKGLLPVRMNSPRTPDPTPATVELSRPIASPMAAPTIVPKLTQSQSPLPSSVPTTHSPADRQRISNDGRVSGAPNVVSFEKYLSDCESLTTFDDATKETYLKALEAAKQAIKINPKSNRAKACLRKAKQFSEGIS
jgi:serine/threonine protein kinase